MNSEPCGYAIMVRLIEKLNIGVFEGNGIIRLNNYKQQ